MSSRWNGAIALILVGLVALIGSCSGGGTNNTNLIGEKFNLLITANPDSGPAPLTVSFFAVPSGGQQPYTYRWDFDGDGVTDSNSNSGVYSYTDSGQATVVVTDNAGDTVTASKTIIVTQGGVPAGTSELDVRYDVTPKSGTVPFNAQFTAYVQGGKEPYKYSWDFDGDGVYDSFIKNPLWTFEHIGQETIPGTYTIVPVLHVEDSRGVTGTNLDDKNNDGNPDFRLVIVANPPAGGLIATGAANPVAGQAPLTVEFTGSATNGSDHYQFKWNFGDNTNTDFADSSIATHTYLTAGNYLATVTVKDMTTGAIASSAPITINATVEQVFGITITSDLTAGEVPFVANFAASPVNGQEPIQYQWDVFDDVTPGDPNPSVTNPPTLNGAAVITPDFTYRKNPAIHFANTAGLTSDYSYAVRCVAVDASGNTAVSNLIRVVASPRSSASPRYEAYRPNVVARTTFPNGSAQPTLQALPSPVPWTARANPAVVAHPSGISFIIGGEVLDENGNFERLVLRGDSVYMHVPRTQSTGSEESSIGKFNTGTLGGGMVRLNDNFAPAFPGPNDRAMPPVPTQRSGAFTIVGSAAAVLLHEIPESNPDGAYQQARQQAGYPYPESVANHWGLDNPMGGDTSGLGSPVIYVLGGRVAANQPVDLVQKYYVYGFGSEDLPYDSAAFGFQTTSNQTDIWSPFFLRPDTDQYPAPDADPDIPDRRASTNDEVLPTLIEPLYGLMACSLESGVDQATPSFPNGPYHYVFVFGGIGSDGSVRDDMRWWNITLPGQGNSGGQTPNGVFSLVSTMPTPRAYGKAVVLESSTGLKIALVGGIDAHGIPLNTIDIFSFNDSNNPATGTWDTFQGTLPEALEACGAGFHPGPGVEDWVLTFGGWTGKDYNSDVYDARLYSPGDLVLREAIKAVPRNMVGSCQSNGSNALRAYLSTAKFNRYYVFGGVDENGSDSVVEVLSLP